MYTFREVDEVFLIFSRLTMMSPSHRWGFPALIDCCVFILTMYVQVAAAEVADQREDFNLAKHQDRWVGFLQAFYL